MAAEPRPGYSNRDNTVYRIEQLEKQNADFRVMFKELSEKLNSIATQQQVHMKQTEILQRTNDIQMESLQEAVGEIQEQIEEIKEAAADKATETDEEINDLKVKHKVDQTMLEKYGPATGATAGLAALILTVLEGLSKMLGK